jgi:deoxyribonuclease IV
MLLGAHVPTKGGLHLAPANGRTIAADAIQVFTRSQLQWEARALAREETGAFRAALRASGLEAVIAHGSYLVNLASTIPDFLRKSRDTMVSEVERCHLLGISAVVFHPGAHMGAGEAAGLRAVASSLDDVIARTPRRRVKLLLEVTAGQGSCLGYRFEHLAEILATVRRPERVGVCLDTCHLSAAGYDLTTPGGYERTFAEFERVIGFAKLGAVHLNDSKTAPGSRRDRHEKIGKGTLSLDAFTRLLRDPRFQGVPAVLETPGDLEHWKGEIALLRRLARRGAVSRPARSTARRVPPA